MSLFPITEFDRAVYQEKLRDFLPEEIIDIHTHVWTGAPAKGHSGDSPARTVSWPDLVARENAIEDLMESYRLLLPGKKASALIFANHVNAENFKERNAYTARAADVSGYPALYFSHPRQSGEEVERAVAEGGFFGLKSYLDLADERIAAEDICIFDFFPRQQLQSMDKLGAVVMLHIPRRLRLRDPVNLRQILEIKERYPRLRLILAHVGRAYCESDVGDALDVLRAAPDLLFDFSANTNARVFSQLLESVGPERVLFGSDLPITRMRMRRICVNASYCNLVPRGLYGDVSGDPHMAEAPEGEELTFFFYEELLAMKAACEAAGFGPAEAERLFYQNARKVLEGARADIDQYLGRKKG